MKKKTFLRFTIIELIVVIFIIIVLAETLFVVGRSVIRRAKINSTKMLITSIHNTTKKVYSELYSSLNSKECGKTMFIAEDPSECASKTPFAEKYLLDINLFRNTGGYQIENQFINPDGIVTDAWGEKLVFVFTDRSNLYTGQLTHKDGSGNYDPIEIDVPNVPDEGGEGVDGVGDAIPVNIENITTGLVQTCHNPQWDIWSAGPDKRYYNLIGQYDSNDRLRGDAKDYQGDYVDHNEDGFDYDSCNAGEEQTTLNADMRKDPDNDNLVNWRPLSGY